jgi:hypothetical protein
MYIKPEGQKPFSIYPDKADLNRFFTTLKQAQDTMDSLRVELAQKYYAMAETKPDLKVDLFGSGQHNEVDMNRIQKVNVFKAKNDVILCAATIDGADKLQPRFSHFSLLARHSCVLPSVSSGHSWQARHWQWC